MAPTRITVRAALACTAITLALAGCGGGKSSGTTASSSTATTSSVLPGAGRPAVVVGDKNTFPEQFVLGDLYEEALAAKGYSVSLNRNIGPLEVALQALKSGSLSMYPEYIDVWDQSVAGYRRRFSSARAAYRAGQRFARTRQLELLNPTPFSDTDGIGVTLTYAVAHDLTTIGNLAKVARTLVVGGPPQFETSPTGLAGIEETYGFAPASFKPIADGEQYHALSAGTIQAADVNTTDGELSTGGYLLLADPRQVFGWGNVVPVVPKKVIAEEGPAFVATINAVSKLLTTSAMRELNAAVASSHEDPKVVAQQFLQSHHLLPAPSGTQTSTT